MMLEAAAAVPPDYIPALLGIGGVVVGGLLAWLASLVGAAKQRKHEHEKWEREQRLEAYVMLARAFDNMPPINPTSTMDVFDSYLEGLRNALIAVHLLGPEPVHAAALKYFTATVAEAKTRSVKAEDDDAKKAKEKVSDEHARTRTAFLTVARETLGIKG